MKTMTTNNNAAIKLRASPSRFSWGVYLALVSLAWLVNYPGRVNPDTLDQLTQAGNLATLNDWQPPLRRASGSG